MSIFDAIFDDSVSTTMNVFLVIGNIINFVYNIPQVVKTYKTKSTRDFSPTFLFMRVIGNCIWLAYSIELKAFLFIVSNIVSVISSIFISYYKVLELLPATKSLDATLDEVLIDGEL
jgi:MtN3 and saliva related transmembrane protein